MYYVCFFKQNTAYEMRISDWSSDVCSSDLLGAGNAGLGSKGTREAEAHFGSHPHLSGRGFPGLHGLHREPLGDRGAAVELARRAQGRARDLPSDLPPHQRAICRSEEHTSELQSLMRISYAVFCLKKTKPTSMNTT